MSKKQSKVVTFSPPIFFYLSEQYPEQIRDSMCIGEILTDAVRFRQRIKDFDIKYSQIKLNGTDTNRHIQYSDS